MVSLASRMASILAAVLVSTWPGKYGCVQRAFGEGGLNGATPGIHDVVSPDTPGFRNDDHRERDRCELRPWRSGNSFSSHSSLDRGVGMCSDNLLRPLPSKDLARDVERKLDDHEVGKLLMTIEGLGPLTAACLIAELGDPARFDSPGAIASYVGVIPRIRQSGKKRFTKGPAIPLGNARLRKSLFMVVLQMVRRNPWLRQYYERLRAAGKPGKVAIIAAMRKLLTAVWSVATHRRPFVPIMPA